MAEMSPQYYMDLHEKKRKNIFSAIYDLCLYIAGYNFWLTDTSSCKIIYK